MKPGYGIWDQNYTYARPHPTMGCWKATGPDYANYFITGQSKQTSIILNIKTDGTFSGSVGTISYGGEWNKEDNTTIIMTYVDPASKKYIADRLVYHQTTGTVTVDDYRTPFYRC